MLRVFWSARRAILSKSGSCPLAVQVPGSLIGWLLYHALMWLASHCQDCQDSTDEIISEESHSQNTISWQCEWNILQVCLIWWHIYWNLSMWAQHNSTLIPGILSNWRFEFDEYAILLESALLCQIWNPFILTEKKFLRASIQNMGEGGTVSTVGQISEFRKTWTFDLTLPTMIEIIHIYNSVLLNNIIWYF